MIHVAPRRLAGMLDNAVAAAKQGNKPYPHIMLLSLDGELTASGVGQHVMIEDTEPGMGGEEDGVAIPYREAETASKAIRGIDGALRKDFTVYATIEGGVFRVENGDRTVVEIADDPEADSAWEFRADAQKHYDTPIRRGDRYTVYDTAILAVLGKLKPAEAEPRIVLYPGHVADTTLFRLNSIRGFIEGNRSDP